MTSRHWSLLSAVLIALIFGSIYATAVVKLDNTNIGTTNGLWKTPMIRGWEKGTGRDLDNGEWLYQPLYGRLCRLIPDRWVAYGTPGPIVTFRKMAMLNAMFGGLASAVVFLLAMRFLSTLLASFVATLAHACAAFVIVNSVNSEDIIPAYTFFLLTTYFLFSYVQTNRLLYLFLAVVCCALVTLLHWTLMIPTLTGVIVVGLVLGFKDRRRAWMPPVFFGVFLVLLELFMLGFGHIHSIREVLYPAKAGPSGYLGLHRSKLIYASIGIGNYFLGGRNISDYRTAFGDWHILQWMKFSWVFAIGTITALVIAVAHRSSPPVLRLLAIFGLVIFGMGELEHLYSQPEDPQSQIQPMFATILGVIVILYAAGRIGNAFAARWFAVASIAVFMLEGAFNIIVSKQVRGEDSLFMKYALDLAHKFPPETDVIVTHGWEPWNTWIYSETYEGDSSRFGARNIAVVNGLVEHPGIPVLQAADFMAKQVSDQIDQGRHVVTNVIWVGSKADFAYGLTNIVDIGQAREYTDRLYDAFHAGKSWDTSVGKFVELLK
jgi:hypothetical protein